MPKSCMANIDECPRIDRDNWAAQARRPVVLRDSLIDCG